VQMGSQMLAILTSQQLGANHPVAQLPLRHCRKSFALLVTVGGEQFYVLWPLFFVGLCALGARRKHWLVILPSIATMVGHANGYPSTPPGGWTYAGGIRY